jgi:hypothetical protein
MDDCKIGQAVVSHKRGRVFAITLNDQWNVLPTDVYCEQEWYVGFGLMRRRNANLAAKTAIPIPLFHAPKMKERTCNIYNVGHYSVIAIHELESPRLFMKKERQLLVRLSFTHFDVNFADIIAGKVRRRPC